MSWQPLDTPEGAEAPRCPAVETVIVPRTRDLGGFDVRRPSGSREGSSALRQAAFGVAWYMKRLSWLASPPLGVTTRSGGSAVTRTSPTALVQSASIDSLSSRSFSTAVTPAMPSDAIFL